ncbi:RNA-binding domain-containing protein [Paractinoplanes brasiliensis]|uniref:RNA-binding domain-containing protein n=1 Tax=Paractinoplanes brasiliensis TaxID=52695 RepID=UPI0019432753|nr:RNA-binding domain-containing protein [Actinoplanes brasiliensis]GID25196.1 ATPase AAA [Actinoplanes brasiliensis]
MTVSAGSGGDLSAQVVRWAAAGEQYDVEFKGERRERLNDRDLLEAVVCLANGRGGVLLVGVEDDGLVTGARARHEAGRTDPLRLQAFVANSTQPPLSVTADVVQVDDKDVLVVTVPDSPRVVGTAKGTYVRRAIGGDGRPTCLPYHSHEMLAHEVDRGAVDWATLAVGGATWDDLDPLEFERVRRLAGASGAAADRVLATLSDREIANALGMTRAGANVTTGALLLFGRTGAIRDHLPTHDAAFQVLRGLEVQVNDFLPLPLVRLAEEVFARFRARNQEEELQFGLLRVSVSTYSETAFREALANALIHRDYTRRGAVYVQWSEEQLEISSPGGFPSGVRLDNLLVAPPHPRSPLLADAFKRIGLVERTGRGINRMFAEQLRLGRPAPDYGRSSDDRVVAVLPGGPANLSMTRWVLEQESQQGAPLGLSELQVLSELEQERRASTSALAHVLQRTDAETRILLTRMVERGWVEARGEGKGRSWHLSAAVYRALEAPAGYVRIRGFEPLQQEQMVLQYVEAHGQINRSQAADLCALTSEQASRLLRRLAREGRLEARGERRGTVYVKPEV